MTTEKKNDIFLSQVSTDHIIFFLKSLVFLKKINLNIYKHKFQSTKRYNAKNNPKI